MKWEYKSIFGDSRVALEEEMNAFGKDRWEFFNITSFGRGSAEPFFVLASTYALPTG